MCLRIIVVVFIEPVKYKYIFIFILYHKKFVFLSIFFYFITDVLYACIYEQDVKMFMCHQTKYGLNCLEKQRDDMVEVHRILRLLMHHDVYPNLKFSKLGKYN
jgi:hypothetical protein